MTEVIVQVFYSSLKSSGHYVLASIDFEPWKKKIFQIPQGGVWWHGGGFFLPCLLLFLTWCFLSAGAIPHLAFCCVPKMRALITHPAPAPNHILSTKKKKKQIGGPVDLFLHPKKFHIFYLFFYYGFSTWIYFLWYVDNREKKKIKSWRKKWKLFLP